MLARPIVSNLILAAIRSWNSFLSVWAPKRAIYESWLKLPLLPVGLVDNKIDKGEYDVLEFCNGLEYELDSFLDYVISTIEDEKTAE